MPGPLNGLFRVLDLSERSPAAAIAGMVLADLGAEVIRVEPEGGDPVRVLPGSRVWFRGQKSVNIGPAQVRNGQWDALRSSADVVLTTAQPWTSKPANLLDGYPDEPRQILAVLTAHPRSAAEVRRPLHRADRPVYGELIEAEYGLTYLQDGWREGPIFLGWPLASCGAAWLLEIGILGALLDRERFGRGQIVTTSLLDGAAILASAKLVDGNIGRLSPGTRSNIRTRNVRAIISLFECGDGNWVQVHTGPRGAFDRLMKLVGRDDLSVGNNDPRILATPLDPAIGKELWPYLDRTFKSKPADYWRELLSANDVACMPALRAGEVFWLKQIEENGQVEIAADGNRQLGKFAKYRRTPIAQAGEIPTPGQHNAILFSQGNARTRDGARSADRSPSRSENAQSASRVGPLDGMLALDFGLHLAGPFAGRMYGDLGARVIKVEEYNGDPVRGPHLDIFLPCNRNKESIAVNLKTDEGRRIIYELVKRADIIHNNMRDGAMDRIGMGYETVSKLNPRIVFCHSSGYGNQGPWSRLPTFEPLHSALSGILRRTGGEGNPPDHYLSNMDIGCGLTATVAVMAALVERECSGVGQYVEVPQVGSGLLAMSDLHGYKDRMSETFPLDHEQRGHAPTNGMYRTSDGWIVIACYSGDEWEAVRCALGLPADEWPGYAQARQERLGESNVARAIEAAISQLTTSEAERRLHAEGAPCVVPRPVPIGELVREPGLRSRAMVVAEHHVEAGDILEPGHMIRFGTATSIRTQAAPIIGQHSVAIMRETGVPEIRIDELINARIVNAAGREPGGPVEPAPKHH